MHAQAGTIVCMRHDTNPCHTKTREAKRRIEYRSTGRLDLWGARDSNNLNWPKWLRPGKDKCTISAKGDKAAHPPARKGAPTKGVRSRIHD